MALIGTAITFNGSASANAADDGPPPHECDRQAAYVRDDAHVAEPVPFERIDAESAMAACREALDSYPGSPRFQLQLSRAYDKAGYVDEAMELLNEAAASGYAGAQNALGARHWYGEGVPQNAEKAVALLRPSAEQGNGYSQALLALAYLQGGGVSQDIERAKHWAEKSAARGNEHGLEFLAILYEDGIGVSRDTARARRLHVQSAERVAALVERGFEFCKDNLFSIGAHLFEQPYQSVDDIDITQVRGWIERLAEDGHADAQYVLGRMYEQGYATPRYRGVPDLDKAYAWFRRAAANGSEGAYERLLDNYMQRLTFPPDYQPVIVGDIMGRPLEEAKSWLQETAEAGRMDSQLALGVAYYLGSGFERDLERAKFWYEKAAAQGSDEAHDLLDEVQADIDRRN